MKSLYDLVDEISKNAIIGRYKNSFDLKAEAYGNYEVIAIEGAGVIDNLEFFSDSKRYKYEIIIDGISLGTSYTSSSSTSDNNYYNIPRQFINNELIYGTDTNGNIQYISLVNNKVGYLKKGVGVIANYQNDTLNNLYDLYIKQGGFDFKKSFILKIIVDSSYYGYVSGKVAYRLFD